MASEVELERMVIRLIGDSTSYQNMLHDVKSSTNRTAAAIAQNAATLEKFGNQINSLTNNVLGYAKAAAALIGIGSLISTAMSSVSRAAEAETSEISFEVMLGSAEKAKKMLTEIKEFAAKTPFEMPGLRSAAQLLLNFGAAPEKIMPALRMLGDVAAGDSNKLSGLALAYSQSQAVGRLTGENAMQMTGHGFNPIKEISRTSGKSMAVLQKELEQGRISLKMLEGAFASASAKGGNFYQMMEKQSGTLSGLFSTLKDDMGNTLTDLGVILIKELKLKELVAFSSETIGKYRDTFLSGTQAVFDAVKKFGAKIWSYLQPVVDAWNSLSTGTKEAIVAGLAAVTSFGPLLTLFATIKTTIITIGAVIGVAFSPIVVLSAAVGIAVYAFIKKMGGIGPAWEYATQKAKEFWEFVSPLFWQGINTAKAYFDILWSIGTWTWESIQEIASNAFTVMTALGGDWLTTTRDFLRDALIFSEYVFRNIKSVGQLAWLNIQLAVNKFTVFVLSSILDVDKHVTNLCNGLVENFWWAFDTALEGFDALIVGFPRGIKITWEACQDLTVAFLTNLGSGFVAFFNHIGTGFTLLGKSLMAVWDNVKDYLSGKDPKEAAVQSWTDIKNSIVATMTELPNIPLKLTDKLGVTPVIAEQLNKLEALKEQLEAAGKSLSEEEEALRRSLVQGYEDFKKKRLEELGKLPEVEVTSEATKLAEVGKSLGEGLGKGLSTPVANAATAVKSSLASIRNAVTVGSVESFQRISEYMDTFERPKKTGWLSHKLVRTDLGAIRAQMPKVAMPNLKQQLEKKEDAGKPLVAVIQNTKQAEEDKTSASIEKGVWKMASLLERQVVLSPQASSVPVVTLGEY